jgi:hypothetical protein
VPLLVALGVVTVPFAVLVVRALGTGYHATSDLAVLEFRLHDVGGSHTPLVGVFSRFPWSHPGPFLFYALAGPFRILGGDGPAMLASGALLNFAAVVGSVLVFWRRGRVGGLVLGTVVLVILLRALGGGFLWFPWNPFSALLPVLLLALVVWCIACGDHWMLPIAVGLASFAAQAHLGSAGVAAGLLVVAVGALVVDGRRHRVHRLLRLVLISAAVGLLAWLPPIIDQLRPSGGNLGALWRYWTGEHTPVTGWSRSGRIVASQFSIPAPWITGHERATPFGGGGLLPPWQFPWVLVLVVGALVVAWRRRDRASVALNVIVLVLTVVAWVSIARIVGEPFNYLVRWSWLLGALAWLAIAWTTMRVFVTADRATGVRRAGVMVAASLAIALTVATTISAVHAELPFPQSGRALHHLGPALMASAPTFGRPIEVQPADDLPSLELARGVALRLDRAGFRAGLPPSLVSEVGVHHVVDPHVARTELVVAVNGAIATFASDARYRVVARYDALTARERAVAERIRSRIPASIIGHVAPLQDWIARHPREWRRLIALDRRGDRAAIFRVTAGAAR